jgi:O-antigen ligase
VECRRVIPGGMKLKMIMDRERLDDWCEKGILALVLGILVFGPLALGAVEAWQLAVIEGMTAGVLALWVARLWIGRRPQFLWPPICWAVLAFVAYAIGRYWRADIEYAARQELIRILIYTFLFLAVLNNLHRQEAMNIIGLTVVVLGMAIAMYACWQFATKSDHVWNLGARYPGRGSGTFIYPNSTAAFLEILLPMALSYVIIGRLPQVTKIFLGYAAAVMLAGIGVTLSRGGWLVTAVTLVVFCAAMLAQRDYWMQGLALAAVLALGGFALTPKAAMVMARIEHTFPDKNPDDMRLTVWQAGVEMWQDHVWWGVGPAHFNYRWRQYRPSLLQQQPVRAHNEYLNVLADWGMVGGVLVAAVWVVLWRGVFQAWKAVRGARDDFSRKKSNKFALLTGAAFGLLAILLHSALDFNLHIPAIAILVVTLMAMLSSQLRFTTERYWFRARLPLKCVATVVFLAGGSGLIWAGWRAAEEDRWVRLAAHEEEISEPRLTDLEKAFAVEPMNFDTTYAIGEWYRNHSFHNMGSDPDALARTAMTWYRRGMKLDPYDGYNWLRYGMCLDWIAEDSASGEGSMPYFQRADELDPNGYFMAANLGWHYTQTGDAAAARTWFERSLRLQAGGNDIAASYLPIVEKRLEESAAKNKP